MIAEPQLAVNEAWSYSLNKPLQTSCSSAGDPMGFRLACVRPKKNHEAEMALWHNACDPPPNMVIAPRPFPSGLGF